MTYLRLPDRHPDKLRPDIRVERQDQRVDKRQELAQAPVSLVRQKRQAVLPIGETDSILAWYAAKIDDKPQQEEADEGDNFEEGEPEPGSSVSS